MTAVVAPGTEAAPATADAVLQVRDLRKSYGTTEVVRGLSFDVPRGRCFGLLGPNGAGKTTTLRLALGLTEPDGGSIRLLGHAVPEHAREARMRVGVVPQMDNLDPDFSVSENLLVFARYFGLGSSHMRSRIPALLEFAGLAGRGEMRIRELSGGMKRRLTLVRALVNDPEILFMDEPTTGLDPQARHLIWARMKTLMGQGKTIVLTTHFMDEAERLCDRLAIVDHGRIVAEDSPRELIRRHIEPEVVEAYGDDAPAWAERNQARLAPLARRVEVSGETVFCYAEDAHPLLALLEGEPGMRFLRRPANLEDVFLRLTGRDLRD